MMDNDDALLREIHDIRTQLWEESGQNLHAMIRLIKREAAEIMMQYRPRNPITKPRPHKTAKPRTAKRRQRAASQTEEQAVRHFQSV